MTTFAVATKFDETVQAALVAEGYVCTSHAAHWEDVGDCENGPKLDGHDAYDEWTRRETEGSESYIIVYDGEIAEVGLNPIFPENFPF